MFPPSYLKFAPLIMIYSSYPHPTHIGTWSSYS
jgi:hypothetical protein